MAKTQATVQLDWGTPDFTKSVTSGATEECEAVTCDATCIDRTIVCKADNSTAPASGDTIDFFLLGSLGDPDADDVADEFSTIEHARFLCRLDTYATTGGEDPAVSAVLALPVTMLSFQIAARSNASLNAITVSAIVYESRE